MFLGESVSWIQYAGMALLFIGIAYPQYHPQYHPQFGQKHMRKGLGMQKFLHPHFRAKKIR